MSQEDLPEVFRTGGAANNGADGEFRTLKQMEAMMIEQALRRHDGNRAAAARELDIDARTLFRKLKTLGLDL